MFCNTHKTHDDLSPTEVADQLAFSLEVDRGQFEILIHWALDHGLDPSEVVGELTEEVATLLMEAAGDYGWRTE